VKIKSVHLLFSYSVTVLMTCSISVVGLGNATFYFTINIKHLKTDTIQLILADRPNAKFRQVIFYTLMLLNTREYFCATIFVLVQFG